MGSLLRFCIANGLVVGLSACGGDGADTPDECNPLGGANCVTPWPSGLYQVEDSSSPTGFRNSIPADSLPISTDDRRIDPDIILNNRTGFNPAAPIVAAFPTGIDDSNLVHYSDYPASVTAASPTVLINADTGDLVEHFAELDARSADTPDKQALIIRPSMLLEFSTRYIVGIKKTLNAKDGGDLPMSDGFEALLEGTSTDHPLLERTRARYEDIFAQLAAHGVNREDLLVAWDFTTHTKEEVQRDMVAMRDRGVAAIGDQVELGYTVTKDQLQDDELIRNRIEGTFTVPNFLSQQGRHTTQTEVVYGGDGLPELQGTYEAPFVALVPECAHTAEEPVGIFLYGHGLNGDAQQAGGGSTKPLVGHECLVVVGTDFRGFCENDVVALAEMLNNPNKQNLWFPVQMQGVLNHIILAKTAQGPMAETLFVNDQGESLVDPSKIYYYGISQGGIMGGTIMSYDQTMTRGVLQAGAMNYSLYLERSADWPTYRSILLGAFPDPLDVTLLIGILQEYWLMDPANTSRDVLTGGVPDTPPKQLLLQMGIADVEVHNVGTEYQARTMGIDTLAPSVKDPYGVPVAEGPLDNALVIFDYGLGDTIPPTSIPPPPNDVHGDIRHEEACVRQIGTFFSTGEILNYCGENGCECHLDGCGEHW